MQDTNLRNTHASWLQLRAMAVDFPDVAGHPNRLPFEGCLTLLDVASDKAPSGARGHRVILTRAAAEAALPSLLGMAVDYKAGWDGHDARQKCGIITAANIKHCVPSDALRAKASPGEQVLGLMVSGYLYARDFPHFVPPDALRAKAKPHTESMPELEKLGMSYELANAHIADMRAPIWTLTRATFTGAAILLREKAAYRGTSFRLCRNKN